MIGTCLLILCSQSGNDTCLLILCSQSGNDTCLLILCSQSGNDTCLCEILILILCKYTQDRPLRSKRNAQKHTQNYLKLQGIIIRSIHGVPSTDLLFKPIILYRIILWSV
uniref:Uncharacterized protein n=1 Tax=Cacopsylla melanoneura TaxID=428564 RepID=A0A8D8RGP1_9HEMI